MVRSALTLAVMLLLTGCGSVASMRYGDSPQYERRRDALKESLFPGDQAVLSNEAIEKILNSKVTMPYSSRIAVVRLGRRVFYPWWSDDVASTDQTMLSDLIEKLRKCERVADAAVLPPLMAPPLQTVPHLRAAAARYQADELLIYRVTYETFEKQRFLRDDEIRAYCVAEAVLLDTRTGIVLFTAMATESFTIKRSKEDFNLVETTRKAEAQVAAKAMAGISDKLVAFIDAMP